MTLGKRPGARKPKAIPGLLSGLAGLFELIESIEELQEQEKAEKGEFKTPSGKKAVYEYRLRIGPARRGVKPARWSTPVHPRKKIGEEKMEPEKKKERLIDVFEEKEHITIVTEVPEIKKRDLELKLVDGLKISARTKDGKIEKEIEIPKNTPVSKIENVSFKHGILEIKLKKRGRKENE